MTVNTTGDPGGGCSLRAAIAAVGAGTDSAGCGPVAKGGTTTIVLPAGHYTLTAGELQIAAGANLAIAGANPNNPAQTVIDAANASRVLEVASGAQATLTGVEVTGGLTASGANGISPGSYGGSGANGGGILNHGSLTLDHVLVTGNMTGHGGRGANGDMSDTTSRYGKGGGPGGSGGGIYNDSGASLTVRGSTISANGTGDGGAGGNGSQGVPGIGHYPYGADGGNGAYSGSGGGILNAGGATIGTTTVSGNFTGRGGDGGAGGFGTGENNANLQSAGRGGDGGAGGNGSLHYSESGNPAYAAYLGGGGIDNAGTLTMTASTISGNHTGAGGNGGGAGLGGERENSTYETAGRAGEGGSSGLGGGFLGAGKGASLTNVTIAGNQTGDGGRGGNGAQSSSRGGGPGGFSGYGGGVWVQGFSPPDYLQLTDVTVAKNLVGAAGQGGIDNTFPGIAGGRGKGAGIAAGPRTSPSTSPSAAGVSLTNTLVAGNGVPASGDLNCVQYYTNTYNDIYDAGHNLSFPDNSCPGLNGDPLLGLLQSNGGPTQTILPASGSPAIEAVPSGSCMASVDQRGYPRPGTGKPACDIGAVETGPAPVAPTTISVFSSSPSTPGQQVTFVATVSPPPSSGTFSFTDEGNVISGCGTVALQPGGQATCSVTYPTAGTHSIVVSYTGNSLFAPATSSTLTQLVQAAANPEPELKPEGGTGGGGTTPSGGSGGGGGTQPAAPTSPNPKTVTCPKSKKRVVRKGKVTCVPKHKHKSKHH